MKTIRQVILSLFRLNVGDAYLPRSITAYRTEHGKNQFRRAAIATEQAQGNNRRTHADPRGALRRRVRRVGCSISCLSLASPEYSLIVASEYDPLSVLEKLLPYLAGSASIVVHSPHVQARTLNCLVFKLLTVCFLDHRRFTIQVTGSSSILSSSGHRSMAATLSGMHSRI